MIRAVIAEVVAEERAAGEAEGTRLAVSLARTPQPVPQPLPMRGRRNRPVRTTRTVDVDAQSPRAAAVGAWELEGAHGVGPQGSRRGGR